MSWLKRNRPAIPVEIADEIEQTMAWWQREYSALMSELFMYKPFNPEDHLGHAVAEVMNFDGESIAFCAECPTEQIPRGEVERRSVE